MTSPRSRRATWARRGAAVLIGLATLGAVELGLRAAGVAPDAVWRSPTLALVVRDGVIQGRVLASNEPHFAAGAGADGAVEVRTAEWARRGTGGQGGGSMRDLRFAPAPSAGVERWAVLGGSSALGLDAGGGQGRAEALGDGAMALPEALSLSGQLRAALGAGGRSAEVLNAGMIAQDAKASRRIGEELLEFGANVLVAFDGNNESIGLSLALYEEQVPATYAEVGVRRLRLFRVLTDWVAPLRGWGLRSSAPPRNVRDPMVLGRFVEAQWRTAGRALVGDGEHGPVPTDDVYAALLSRYAGALGGLAEAARARGARVIAVPTPPNLAWPPMGAIHGPSASGKAMFEHQKVSQEGMRAIEAGNAEAALAAGRTAVALDPEHAMGHWLVGSALGRLGDPEGAVDALVRAHALDAAHRRTVRGFVDVARDVCARLGCLAVDLDAPLRARARAEGPGVYGALFGDHEHLTPEGNAWVGEQIARAALADQGAVRPGSRAP